MEKEMKDKEICGYGCISDLVFASIEYDRDLFTAGIEKYYDLGNIYGSSLKSDNYEKHRNMKMRLATDYIFNEYIPNLKK